MTLLGTQKAQIATTEAKRVGRSDPSIRSLFTRLQWQIVPAHLYPRNTVKRRLAVILFQVAATLTPLLILFLAFFHIVDSQIFAPAAKAIVSGALEFVALVFVGVFVSLKCGRPFVARSLAIFAAFVVVLTIIQTTGGLRSSVAATLIILPSLLVFYFFSIRTAITVMILSPLLAIGLDLGNELLGFPIQDFTSQSSPMFNRMSVLATLYLIVNLCLISLFRSVKQAHAEQQGEHRHLTDIANEDALTGIGNKRWFEQKLHETADMVEQSGDQMIVFNVDLNNFKPVNDNFGHSAGDQLLIQIAHRLRDLCGPQEAAARIGGDEFALIFIRGNSENEAADIGRLIETTISVPYYATGQLMQVSGSVGFCMYPKHTNIRSSITRHADKDMFRRKAEQREQDEFRDSHQSKIALSGPKFQQS